MNSGVEQKQGRLGLFGPSYLQHIQPNALADPVEYRLISETKWRRFNCA
jgi:hypothetical protein